MLNRRWAPLFSDRPNPKERPPKCVLEKLKSKKEPPGRVAMHPRRFIAMC